MIFSSFIFLFFFLIITIGLYYVCPKRIRNLVLVVTSLVFYAWGEPIYVTIMLSSILFNWIIGILIHNSKERQKESAIFQKLKVDKVLIIICCIVNLGTLGFFKYTNFFFENVNSIFDFAIESLEIVMPIGISFYTFQTLSYVIDVYLGKVKVQKNIIDFAAFVTMFPQLIAGPIVRYSDIDTQLVTREESFEKVSKGIIRFIAGLGKKVLFANKAGAIWEAVYSNLNGEMTVSMAWLGAIAFTFQIYFDFSGYSDMAVGLGQMFGFDFPENFKYPYISRSITDFWRRWHITLSSWFKEYVYIPLGGNRKGKGRQILNLFIVWALTGLWHGASWNFVIWGIYFFALLMLEKLFLLKFFEKLPKFFSHVYSLFFIIIGWIIFSCTSITEIGTYIQNMFYGKLMSDYTLYLLGSNAILLILMGIASTPIPKKVAKGIAEKLKLSPETRYMFKIVASMIVFVLSIAYLTGDSYNPFLYFRF
ncbi:MAG: MBOAT family protein [Ruminococcaceae bacterium]|nr:MBOAT family protein [Oscillospiraceae bacterium]